MKKVFNFAKYQPAIEELWAKKVPDVTIARIMGVCNTVISRYRRSFKLPFVVSNTKVLMSDEDIKQVFIKHNCFDFSDDALYGANSNTCLKVREAIKDIGSRKIVEDDFLSPHGGEFALSQFIYYNLWCPQSHIINFINRSFLHRNKPVLSMGYYNSLYLKATSMYKDIYKAPFRFAMQTSVNGKLISEKFLVYVIYYFAEKARNKNSNPAFIRKYCQFIYDAHISNSYLEDLYKGLNIAINRADPVPSDEEFLKERAALAKKECTYFVPFSLCHSSSDKFTLPYGIATRYRDFLSTQPLTYIEDDVLTSDMLDAVKVPSAPAEVVSSEVCKDVSKSEPIKAVPETAIAKEEVSVITNPKTPAFKYSPKQDVKVKSYTVIPMKEEDFTDEEKLSILLDRLGGLAREFSVLGEHYLASQLLLILHSKKHDIKYNINMKEGD